MIVGLLNGSTYNMVLIKSFIPLENTLGISLKFPLIIFKHKYYNESASKGGFNAHNSYNTTPNDHISDLKL